MNDAGQDRADRRHLLKQQTNWSSAQRFWFELMRTGLQISETPSALDSDFSSMEFRTMAGWQIWQENLEPVGARLCVTHELWQVSIEFLRTRPNSGLVIEPSDSGPWDELDYGGKNESFDALAKYGCSWVQLHHSAGYYIWIAFIPIDWFTGQSPADAAIHLHQAGIIRTNGEYQRSPIFACPAPRGDGWFDAGTGTLRQPRIIPKSSASSDDPKDEAENTKTPQDLASAPINGQDG